MTPNCTQQLPVPEGTYLLSTTAWTGVSCNMGSSPCSCDILDANGNCQFFNATVAGSQIPLQNTYSAGFGSVVELVYYDSMLLLK